MRRKCFSKKSFAEILLPALLISCSSADPSKETKKEKQESQNQTITTKLGLVTGIKNKNSLTFLGVPYAAAPIGEKRWLPPQKLEPSKATLKATSFPNRCFGTPYIEELGNRDIPGEFNEDCLYLNIYTPTADNKKRPVLFWIHGGAFIQGSANEYDGSALAEENDVVVVALNYRLGAFGFLDLSSLGKRYENSAALGFLDQIAALKWVRDNISDYGGNSNNVSIFGESAGASSVLALLAAPLAKGLYHKAMAFSPGETTEAPNNNIPALEKKTNTKGKELIDKLKTLSAKEVHALQTDGIINAGGTVDGIVIKQKPSLAIIENGANGVPLITGSNKDEGTFLVNTIPSGAYDFMTQYYGKAITNGDPSEYVKYLDVLVPSKDPKEKMMRVWLDYFRASSLRAADLSSVAGPGGWHYSFEVPGSTPLGTTHGSEIAFTFNMLNFPERMNFPKFHDANETNKKLANLWSKIMINFAKKGDPNGEGLPLWPKYDREKRSALVFDTVPKILAMTKADFLNVPGFKTKKRSVHPNHS